MKWAKGQSGNPKGRPPGGEEIRAIARQHTETAIQTLIDIAKNGTSESARVTAAVALLDRGHGKPMQTQHVLTEPAPVLTREEAAAVVRGSPQAGAR